VVAALLDRLGIPFDQQPKLLDLDEEGPTPGTATGPVYTAARRLIALPTAAQRAWLTANLPALRSGTLTLEQLP
jgi:hypothetical protein